MSCRDIEARLDDYVDGELSAGERREVERHVAGCPACGASLAFLERLRAEASSLPPSIEPGRDLWPEIAARLDTPRIVRVDFGDRRSPASPWQALRRYWAPLATAATVLVVLSSALTAWWLGGAASDAVAPEAVAPVTPAADAFEAGEAQYALAIEELMSVLYEHGDQLDPETVAVIDANLRVIDSAIRRAREALENDPRNPELARMLSNNYRMKLQLLQRASRLIERTL